MMRWDGRLTKNSHVKNWKIKEAKKKELKKERETRIMRKIMRHIQPVTIKPLIYYC